VSAIARNSFIGLGGDKSAGPALPPGHVGDGQISAVDLAERARVRGGIHLT
jgi:hypothetical protein